MVRFLIRCGSRAYFVAGLVTSLVMFGRGCEAECDNCEPDLEPLVCEQETCPITKCILNQRCSEFGSCLGDPIDGWEDANACTVDICDPETGEVSHEPPVLDDGNDCTSDYCDTTKGVIHEDLCGDA